MIDLSNNTTINNIFTYGKKCIVNTDLDGILSGMLLQKFLSWEIVGFSCCCGTQGDNLWLADENANLKECVFVDLPVCDKDISIIDQHFVLFDKDTQGVYNCNNNKSNPNLLRNRVLYNQNRGSDYTAKYPFGTVHFILAVLENLRIIDQTFVFDFEKRIGAFDLVDLICRADRVIGNTNLYRNNCIDWANWLIEIGGANTNILFNKAKTEYYGRINAEREVENKLIGLGCIGKDGDCSNMFRRKDYNAISRYFAFLSDALGMQSLPLFEIVDLNKFRGSRLSVAGNIEQLKEVVSRRDVFSYALVSKQWLSLTYLK